ncbi:MAG: hypothetical protein CME13_05615 [Gemmatimonadetes bacterium]|nr:hypothetical protein [Gemmatimonadota bacterium]
MIRLVLVHTRFVACNRNRPTADSKCFFDFHIPVSEADQRCAGHPVILQDTFDDHSFRELPVVCQGAIDTGRFAIGEEVVDAQQLRFLPDESDVGATREIAGDFPFAQPLEQFERPRHQIGVGAATAGQRLPPILDERVEPAEVCLLVVLSWKGSAPS